MTNSYIVHVRPGVNEPPHVRHSSELRVVRIIKAVQIIKSVHDCWSFFCTATCRYQSRLQVRTPPRVLVHQRHGPGGSGYTPQIEQRVQKVVFRQLLQKAKQTEGCSLPPSSG